MIPLSDQGASKLGFPILTVILIIINALVFVYEMSLGDARLQQFVLQFGVRPAEITTGQDLAPLLPADLPVWVTLFSSMFMHGGWLHFGGNMLYLWVFGDNIEHTLGKIPYLLFYLFCGLAAAGAQIAADPASRVPSLGASGAIAGVLGAYLVLFPRNKVNTLLILGYFIRMIQLPAIIVLGFWIVLQLFSGVASIGAETDVAYWAHIGGFVAGLIIGIPIALTRRNRNTSAWEM